MLKKTENRLLTRAARNRAYKFALNLPSRDREGAVLPFLSTLLRRWISASRDGARTIGMRWRTVERSRTDEVRQSQEAEMRLLAAIVGLCVSAASLRAESAQERLSGPRDPYLDSKILSPTTFMRIGT